MASLVSKELRSAILRMKQQETQASEDESGYDSKDGCFWENKMKREKQEAKPRKKRNA